MKLIVGLGNPGREYENTRHNVGFSFIDVYLKYHNIDEKWISKFDGKYIQTNLFGEKVLFLKPQTFMNLSGISVRKIMNYFDIDISDLLVISDDLDLYTGHFKFKLNGSCGGHNGLRNIEEQLGTSDYKRLKIGISKDNNFDTKDYVLGSFSKKEHEIIHSLFEELCPILDEYFSLPFGDLMSKYNRKNK